MEEGAVIPETHVRSQENLVRLHKRGRIREDGELDAMVAEKITVTASHRIETGA